ncbi:MAG: hypothetical protein WC716_09050 [Chitinophagaceae bacterium]
MGLFVISGLIFLMVCIGVAIVLTSLILLFIFGFISAGILSAAVMSSIYKRSFAAGFKTFIYASGCIFGTLAGIGFFLLLHKISHWWTLTETMVMGSLIGLAGGYLIGLLVFYTVRKLSSFFKSSIK